MYENIKSAIDQGNGKLSPQEQAKNYEIFGKMMKEGVSLSELIKRIDTLENEVKDMRKPTATIDAELFTVMEQAVKDDPDVMECKRLMQSEKTRIISELCIQDEAYRKRYEAYRTAVNSAYIRKKEASG